MSDILSEIYQPIVAHNISKGREIMKKNYGVVISLLEELISIQVEAIKNIKIDKITVWDTGAGADGKGSTANFLSGLMQSVPPLNDLFKQAGMSLPDFLGEDIQEALKKSQKEAVKRAAEADNAETLDPKDVEVIEPEK